MVRETFIVNKQLQHSEAAPSCRVCCHRYALRTGAHLLVVWHSGSVVCRMNWVTLHRAGLVLGWLTVFDM